MNPLGVKCMQQYLPDAVVILFSRIFRDNQTFKKLRQCLNSSLDIDWAYVFRRNAKNTWEQDPQT